MSPATAERVGIWNLAWRRCPRETIGASATAMKFRHFRAAGARPPRRRAGPRESWARQTGSVRGLIKRPQWNGRQLDDPWTGNFVYGPSCLEKKNTPSTRFLLRKPISHGFSYAMFRRDSAPLIGDLSK